MEQTSGIVQRLNLAANAVCVWIGPDPSNVEIFVLEFRPGDGAHALDSKKSLVNLLVKARGAGYEIGISHAPNESMINSISLSGFDISPVGFAIRNDFYSITGSGIPQDAEFVFENDTTVVSIAPDMVRPHWAFLSELPAAVPLRRVNVSLQGSGYASDAVPIDVFARPPERVRVLYPGAPKGDAYTLAFVANPMLEVEEGGHFIADPILADRTGFHEVVTHALTNLLTEAEDLLRQDNMDVHMRFVAVFDDVLADSNDSNALVKLVPPNLIGPRQNKFRTYMARYDEVADVAFAISASSTHTRASARNTQDAGDPNTAFTYDGDNHVHGHFAEVPGACTLSRFGSRGGLTPLHEFGHMASDLENGRVTDLYVDGNPGGFQVNKKFRANSGDAVPNNFGDYDGTDFLSDQNRDSLGYPATWTSYHAVPIDPHRPNLMDDYWRAATNIRACRLDRITYELFSDRLRAKVFR